MSAMRVMPAFDELKLRVTIIQLRAEAATIQRLALQGFREALVRCIVVAVSDRPHRMRDARFPSAPTEGERCALAALTGVAVHASRVSSPDHGFLRLPDQLDSQPCRHGPPHGSAGRSIWNEGHVQGSCPGREVGDVSHPALVRPNDGEATNQVRCSARPDLSHGSSRMRAADDALQCGDLRQPTDVLLSKMHTLVAQLSMDARCPVGPSRVTIDPTDPLSQGRIVTRALGPCTLQPRIATAGRDVERSGHRGHRMGRPVGAHEFLEDSGGTAQASLANQTAALVRISPSMQSCLFSRRRPTSSRRSAVVGPALATALVQISLFEPIPGGQRLGLELAGAFPRACGRLEPAPWSVAGILARTADAFAAAWSPSKRALGLRATGSTPVKDPPSAKRAAETDAIRRAQQPLGERKYRMLQWQPAG